MSDDLVSSATEWWKRDGLSPLHVAAYCGNFDELVGLLKGGADANVVDSAGNTPLYWASFKSQCSADYVRVVEELLAAGAKVDLRASEGNGPLVAACQAGNAKVVALLLQAGADPNDYFDHRPPIVAAAQCGCSGCISLLMSAGADLCAVGEFGMTAREWAVAHNFDAVIAALDAVSQ